MKAFDLLSVVILCDGEKNRGVFRSIDSVLKQDYPNIEVIVGYNHFDSFEALINYTVARRRPNIRFINMRENVQYGHTLANLSALIARCHGEYVTILSAEDAFYDYRVISDMATTIRSTEEPPELLLSKVSMYEKNFAKSIATSLSESELVYIKEQDKHLLFSYLALNDFLPLQGAVFQTNFLKVKLQELSDLYMRVVTWPLYLRCFRSNCRLWYLSESVRTLPTCKVEKNGLFHITMGNLIPIVDIEYYQEFLTVYSNDVAPYESYMLSNTTEQAREYFEYHDISYGKLIEKAETEAILPSQTQKEGVRTRYKRLVKERLLPILSRISRVHNIFRAAEILLLFLLSFLLAKQQPGLFWKYLAVIFGLLGGLLTLLLCGQILVKAILIWRGRRAAKS